MRRSNGAVRLSVALSLLALAAPGWAADLCADLPKPSVTIKRLEAPITLNTTYGYRSLTNLGSAQARPGQQVLGLTRGNAMARFASNTPVVVDARGRWECASPQIVLTYGFSPLTVYVAREFPPGSCAHKEIHDHEMRHVQTYQAHLADIEKTLTDALNARFATGTVWRGPAGQAADRLQSELNERWLPYVQREIGKVDAAQARIDTVEEYTRVTNACDGQIAKRLQQRN
ncbi:hypothetical protein LZ012_13445 [Dechloromonas sp. XY25]|uniref:DUF922 domain-containing protein n=1 Tax=Dechloromonas hankyongensis TaxID=2908002 RepID=A0ABS9K4C7_9RHOO|nr:hypothetical protein [Dechloromonas hankyongensis]MCG2577995.1 hypothetical protein [Dechloromonas hankyongensis]